MDEELSRQAPPQGREAEPAATAYRNGTNGVHAAWPLPNVPPLPTVPPLPEPTPGEPRPVTEAKPEPGSMYWQQNMAGQGREILWYNPPLPTSQLRRDELGAMVTSFTGLLGDRSPRGWFLQWTYQSRAAAAQEEAERLEEESRQFLKAETERAEIESAAAWTPRSPA